MEQVRPHLELWDLPPAVAEKLMFDEAAPRRLRGDRLPAEAQAVLRELWDGIVADVYDEVAGQRRTKLWDKQLVARVLQRVAFRMQQGERALLVTGVYHPLAGDADWKQIGLASAGSGGAAAAEELAAYLSVGSGTTIAVTSAIVAELFETYVAASARTRQYRRAGRSPDAELVALDLAEALGFGGSVGRRSSREVAQQAVRWLGEHVAVRTGARFARGLLPVVGVVANAGVAGRNVRRVVQLPLRRPSEDEIVREANDLLSERGYHQVREDFQAIT
jgi:hypothetical protein